MRFPAEKLACIQQSTHPPTYSYSAHPRDSTIAHMKVHHGLRNFIKYCTQTTEKPCDYLHCFNSNSNAWTTRFAKEYYVLWNCNIEPECYMWNAHGHGRRILEGSEFN
jgi:hypothetical protein